MVKALLQVLAGALLFLCALKAQSDRQARSGEIVAFNIVGHAHARFQEGAALERNARE